ncbi:uncharacterized protein [Asterias amurensis]|uniref:uncharacterized protein n=1 Tax=Asterias amurensis TaxID=7602 RepID=UPI003AB8A8D8
MRSEQLKKTLLAAVPWGVIDYNDINDALDTFSDFFLNCVKECVPVRKGSKRAKPWITEELHQLILEKQRLFKRARVSGTETAWKQFKLVRNKVRNLSKRAYSDFVTDLFKKRDNRKTFWSFVKSKRKSSQSTNSYFINGENISDPSRIANEFNSLFASFFSGSTDQDRVTSPTLEFPPLERFSITSTQVSSEIRNLSAHKAYGPDALVSAISRWLQSLDAWVPAVDVISLDFSRAFDTISHDILVKKLQLCYNIKGAALDWIESFVTNRLQRVVYKGFTSDWLPVGSGVPQGSVLGPLIFVLYANDLQLQLSSNLVQYADDTSLFKNVTTDAPDSLLQKDLNTIVNWAKLNCLRSNADKCKSIRLTWRRMSKPEYNLGNSPLECVDSIKLLGCIFQSNLSWDLQVQAVTSKCNRLIGLIRLISGNCPSCVSLHLFKTLVQPILDYCSPVWEEVESRKRLSENNAEDKLRREALQKYIRRAVASRQTSVDKIAIVFIVYVVLLRQ